jgi:hypothetical protein
VPGSRAAALIGLTLGDHDEANRRGYKMTLKWPRDRQCLFVIALIGFILDVPEEDDRLHPAVSLLEALARLDHGLVAMDAIEQLANAESFSKRSSAAFLLWDLVLAAPGEVPIGLLGKLAQPDEDWYVYAPAMAASKELLLVRPAARSIFEGLVSSAAPENRQAAVLALRDVASVDPADIPRDLILRLKQDSDQTVAAEGEKASDELVGVPERHPTIAHFGL